MRKLWTYLCFLLFLIFSLLVISIVQIPDGNLHVTACDVGQGDAILISFKNFQILTDGGVSNSVLSCLGRHLPYWDRKLELVISTHPDSDHINGLVEVVRRYKIGKLIINPINSGTPVISLLEKEVGSRDVDVLYPTSDKSIRLDLIQLDILSPSDRALDELKTDANGSVLSKYINVKDTNLYSIVYRLSFKKFSGLFLADIPPEVSELLSENSNVDSIDYIKIPHHGSKNGLTQDLLEKTAPKIAVISVGKGNPWGFPSKEILDMLSKFYVKVFRTDQLGDVEIITDGDKIWRR